jgi:hypothetical protein
MSAMQVLIYITAYLLALGVGHFFVKAMLKKFRPGDAQGVPGAGAVIGTLERALVLTLVLTSQYTAIGLALTAKSIARYKELEDRRFAEYYLIGTLASILFAIGTGILTKWALDAVAVK